MATDDQLRAQVIDELNSVPSLGGRQIEVDVRMGMVSMTGHVASIDERIAADAAATRIVGQDRIARGVSVRRGESGASSAWVQEVQRSLEHDPNNIHRHSRRHKHS